MTENSKGRKGAGKGRGKARGGPRNGAGRPSYRPSIEQRQTVEEMKFCGEAEDVIARAVGIDVDTLRKHFEAELADGHAQRRKEVISLLFKEARSGNVSAIRRLEEMGRATIDEGRGAREPQPVKLGKKEQQQQAASQVSGIFSPPAPPRLVVSNE